MLARYRCIKKGSNSQIHNEAKSIVLGSCWFDNYFQVMLWWLEMERLLLFML